jgi:hypothetical protein
MIPFAPANKYRNKFTEIDGIHFTSRAEAKWYGVFKAQKAAGEIRDFRMQVPFELVPAQKAPVTKFDKHGNPRTVEKVIELAVKYVADFVVDENDGTQTVYDVKGFPDQKYPIKRKLMRYVHGIAIQEVK